MRIISKFHDYYDTALGYGADPNVLYLRNEEEIDIKVPDKPWNRYWDWRFLRGEVEHVIIGFCGKLYPAFVMTYVPDDAPSPEFTVTTIAYTPLEYETYVKTRVPKQNRVWAFERYNSPKDKKRVMDRFFAGTDYGHLLDVFRDKRVPAFVYFLKSGKFTPHLTNCVLNPCLKDLEFYRIFDSFRAFQEISMYISGVLGVGEPKTVEISNDDMRDKKGFDDKSFKQTSPGKKRKRRNK